MKTENIHGFIWAVLTEEESKEIINTNSHELFALYDDETEAWLSDDSDFQHWIDYDKERGVRLGIEIGAEKELKADYLETVERNNENRTFKNWCLSKIE